MLFDLPNGHSADAVRVALAETVQRLPEHLWQSLTWDQGKEMAVRSRQLASTTLEGVDTQSVVATRIVLWGKF